MIEIPEYLVNNIIKHIGKLEGFEEYNGKKVNMGSEEIMLGKQKKNNSNNRKQMGTGSMMLTMTKEEIELLFSLIVFMMILTFPKTKKWKRNVKIIRESNKIKYVRATYIVQYGKG